jgi:low affinity Fe/Cu permease
MKRFGRLFTSNRATIGLLLLLAVSEGGSGLLMGWSKEWADDLRLGNSIVSVIFLILLHNREYRGVQKRVEDEEAADMPEQRSDG